MIEASQLPVEDLIKSLASKTCPICGGSKRPRHTLCKNHYSLLPYNVRANLYCRVGNGYAQAVAAAMNAFGATEFKLPPAAPPNRERPNPTLFGGRS